MYTAVQIYMYIYSYIYSIVHGYLLRRHMLEPVRPEAVRQCYPTGRCAYRPSVTSCLSIKLLCLSLSLSLARSLALVATYKLLESFVSNKLSLSLVQRVCM